MITQIIPAIDIIGGKCVRLTKGDYSTKVVYGDDPVEVARRFADVGCRRLHLVDLDGAKANHIVNHAVLEKVCMVDNLVVDFGGVIKSDDYVRIARESGASMVTCGSMAIKNPEAFVSLICRYGPEYFILGADARDGKVSANGWLEDSSTDVVDFIQSFLKTGVNKVISTDISMDGTLSGPSIDLYKRILVHCPDIYLIASGGVGNMSDVIALGEIDVPAVIVGKALYEGCITLRELERLNLNC